jgi:hypothetical protein
LTAAHERESELKERNADLLVRLGLVEAALGEAERLKMEEKTRREMAESEARRWRALVETKVQREEVSEDMVETAKTRLSDLLGKVRRLCFPKVRYQTEPDSSTSLRFKTRPRQMLRMCNALSKP